MTSAPGPELAVIVVAYNGRDLLRECLTALAASDLPRDRYELCVVDNASTDGAAEMVAREFPDAVLVRRDDNGGFAAGVNTGIASTTAPVLVLINSDARVDPAALRAFGLGLAEAPTEVAALTGLLLLEGSFEPSPVDGTGERGADGRRWLRRDHGTTLINSTGNIVSRSGNGMDRDWLIPLAELSASRDVFGLCGGAAAIRRDALRRVGVLDESFFMYYEDTELSWRLRRAGYRIEFEPSAVIHHRHAGSSGTGTELFRRHNARNRCLVAARHAPWPTIANAYARTLGRALAGVRGGLPGLRRAGWLIGQLCWRTPAELARRRRIDRRASVPRATVARYLVPDR